MNYTHYDYLGIPPGADDARIEAAYMKMLQHLQYVLTDVEQDLSGLVRRIHAAYDVLTQQQSRQAYDAALAHEAAQADRELNHCSMPVHLQCSAKSRTSRPNSSAQWRK